MKYLLAITLIVSLIHGVQAQKMTTNGGALDDFRKCFRDELTEAGIVGASFAFLKVGESESIEVFGLANKEKSVPIDEQTIYHWASNTKTLTGIAIMQLRDRGLLRLEDRVTKYLPELSKIRNPYGSMDDVTIRHLMNHSSGLRNPTFPWKKGLPWEPFEPKEYSQLEATLPFTELLFEPGSRFGYSNPGIVFLGRIIEKLSGEDYEVYIDKNIFRSLGMDNSYFDSTPPHLLKNRSHSYHLEKGKLRAGRFDADTGITVSNGGLNAPLPDMVKYFRFLLGDESMVSTHEAVLSRSSLMEMFEPTIKSETDANGNLGFTTHIGLTFFLDDEDGDVFIGHGGDQNGFISYTEFSLKRKTASILVFNTEIISDPPASGNSDFTSRIRREIRKLHKSF